MSDQCGHVAITVPALEEPIASVRARCREGEMWDRDQFRDRYGIGWQLGIHEFKGSGDASARWLQL
jgi:hypothetical protein